MTTTTTTTDPTGVDSFGFDIDAVPDKWRDRVAAIIPDPALVDVYVSRRINGVLDLDAFAGHLVDRENVLIHGPASTGKSLAPRVFAARHRLPFAVLDVNGGIDLARIWGEWQPDPDDPTGQRLHFVYSDPALVVLFGGVLLFNEVNMAHERIMAGFNALTSDERRLTVGNESIRLAYPSLIVGTMNPPGGAAYRGTRELNGATADRFQHMVWDYDPAVESALVQSPALLELARSIREQGDIVTPVGTRALMAFERAAGRFGIEYALARFVDRFREAERAGVRRAVEMNTPAIAADLADVDGGAE